MRWRGKEASSAFLKKSAQKTFTHLLPSCVQHLRPGLTKVFCFFFSKKKRFLSFFHHRAAARFWIAAPLRGSQ